MAHLVFLDLEMTGCSPPPVGDDRIVEIGLWREDADRVRVTSWQTLIKAGRASCESALAIHGLADATLDTAPTMHEVAGQLWAQVDGTILIGHGIDHDLGFLQVELPDVPWDALGWIDTRRMAQKCVPLRQHTLASVAGYFGIEQRQAHRALDDARVTREVFWRMYERMGQPRWSRLVEQTTPRVWRPQVVEVLRHGLARDEIVGIEYDRGRGGVTREIRVQSFSGASVHAFCLLRGAARCFRLDRIVRAWPVGGPPL